MIIERDKLSVCEFKSLAKSVGWGYPSDEQIELALKNSLLTVKIIMNNEAVAMGRLLGDMGMSYFIKDVVVNPKYQGKGLGKLVILEIEAYIKEIKNPEWMVCVELMSASGKEGFYKGLGYQERPDEKPGHGMTKMMR